VRQFQSALMTVRQFAKGTAISPTFTRQLIREGRLKGVRIGRKWFIPKTEFDRVIDKGV
jgi:excisionase family DNA binding protein